MNPPFDMTQSSSCHMLLKVLNECFSFYFLFTQVPKYPSVFLDRLQTSAQISAKEAEILVLFDYLTWSDEVFVKKIQKFCQITLARWRLWNFGFRFDKIFVKKM